MKGAGITPTPFPLSNFFAFFSFFTVFFSIICYNFDSEFNFSEKPLQNIPKMIKKKIIAGILLALTLISAPLTVSAAPKGEKTFGIRTGYVSRNKSADLGLYFQYSFSKYFRLQPAVDLVFRHEDRDAFTVDLNGQVPIDFSSDKFSLYPFAGLNFSSWNRHNVVPGLDAQDFNQDRSSRSNYFGVNLGAGFDLKLSPTLKLTLEGGYTFVKSNSGVRILAGIGYVF